MRYFEMYQSASVLTRAGVAAGDGDGAETAAGDGAVATTGMAAGSDVGAADDLVTYQRASADALLRAVSAVRFAGGGALAAAVAAGRCAGAPAGSNGP
ncbi:hypothetical protein, partial [Burkholderia ubonensis]|uniref:hypothetical protein n=1 Tax=Burkholderia ubonensis TaxID=101571 RepID=UPI0019D4C679